LATVVSRVDQDGPRERPLTIGAVCRLLADEFPDISISKIRYLEDQGLLAPRRTQGGYRLFTEDDVDRLQTILRLQRDEFLPLRVIRQELAAPSRKPRPPCARLRVVSSRRSASGDPKPPQRWVAAPQGPAARRRHQCRKVRKFPS